MKDILVNSIGVLGAPAMLLGAPSNYPHTNRSQNLVLKLELELAMTRKVYFAASFETKE